MAIFELVPLTEALEKVGQVEPVDVGAAKDEVQAPARAGSPAKRLDEPATEKSTARGHKRSAAEMVAGQVQEPPAAGVVVTQRPAGLVAEVTAEPQHEDSVAEVTAAGRQEQAAARGGATQGQDARDKSAAVQQQEAPPVQGPPRQGQLPAQGPAQRVQPKYVTDIPRLPPLSDGQPPAREGKDRRSGYGPANPRGNRPFRHGR